MRVLAITAFTAALVLSPAVRAQNMEDLPSAPSAVKQEENRPKAPPAPPPAPPPQATAGSGSPSAPVVDKKPEAKSEIGGGPAAAAATPATPTDEPENSNITIRVGVDEVNVVFTVTDKRGKFIKDLSQKDFLVIDDNRPAQSIRYFNRQSNLPLRVGLLVDASNSIRDRFKFEQEAAIEFLNQIIRPKTDQAFVIGFDTTAEVTADFTSNTEVLSKGVHMLRPGGGTALYDAVYRACRDKLMKADTGGSAVRRAIVLLSDGDDNQSRVTREEAIEMAQRAEVIIYAISTNSTGYKDRGDKVLERMAEATGGRAFYPFKAEDVANAFSAIQDELRSQYQIAYKPAGFVADGHYRAIDIQVASNKSLKTRARKGYFAPKQ